MVCHYHCYIVRVAATAVVVVVDVISEFCSHFSLTTLNAESIRSYVTNTNLYIYICIYCLQAKSAMDGKGIVGVIREHLHLLLIIIFSHLANTLCETFFFALFFHKSFLVLLLCTLVFICHCVCVCVCVCVFFPHCAVYQGAQPNTVHNLLYTIFHLRFLSTRDTWWWVEMKTRVKKCKKNECSFKKPATRIHCDIY